ncbi:glycine betaine/proline transport system permease protein [Peptoniphilus ivorii]|uniref:ABC transporter permease n=1 Tax=Aedoeadaptatus ivorii TaxID=54006 RepID=UPI0027837666|nr:ABC transporter permease subunit [Peptoniphilus ivorii]MDQ0508723.1 glycine betaine/proline transport system permease protein [Peptoniphilus ivorii]
MMHKLPISQWFDAIVEWMRLNLVFLFEPIKNGINALVELFGFVLSLFHPAVFIVLVMGILFFANHKKLKPIVLIGGLSFLFIWNQGIWDDMILTLSLVLVSALLAVVLGVPLGIWMSKSDVAQAVIMPILDFMQTMPAFVYLIPAVSFFGIGMAPGVVSSIIFAMPPVVRMTNLGIRQVPKELIEATESFGADGRQRLFGTEIPLAKKSIMAGVNQTLMLTLSMVVVASMIGAPGLGNRIYVAVSRNEVGPGFITGIAIVILAILLDRITRALTEDRRRD